MSDRVSPQIVATSGWVQVIRSRGDASVIVHRDQPDEGEESAFLEQPELEDFIEALLDRDQRIVSRKFVEASRRIAKDFADLVADHNGFDYAQSYLNHIHEDLEIIDEVPA